MYLYEAQYDGIEVYSIKCINDGTFRPVELFDGCVWNGTYFGDVVIQTVAPDISTALNKVLEDIKQRQE
jgi:hypothetical protein